MPNPNDQAIRARLARDLVDAQNDRDRARGEINLLEGQIERLHAAATAVLETAQMAYRRWDGDENDMRVGKAILATLRAAEAMTTPDGAAPGKEKEVVYIARCPVHGLHGERHECFICGGPVERVPHVEAAQQQEADLG
jgi:hypothetical protein